MDDDEARQNIHEAGALQISYGWDELSDELRETLSGALRPDDSVRRVVCSDLLFSGRFGEGMLVQTEAEFILLDDDFRARRIPSSDLESIVCRELVGNGLLEGRTREGVRVELQRFSRTLSQSFQELTEALNDELGVGESQRERERLEASRRGVPRERRTWRCPKCGHPRAHANDPCPYCSSKRKMVGRLVQYLFRHPRLLLVGTVTSLAVVSINLAPPVLVRMLIDRALVPEDLTNAVRLQRIYSLVGLFFVLIVVRMGVQYIRIRAMGQLGAQVVMDLRRDLFRALQRLSLSYYDNEHTGRIMSRVLSDTSNIQGFVVNGLQQMAINALMVIGIPVIMLQQHSRLALVALLPIPVAAYLGKVFSKRYKTVFRTLKRRIATLSAAVSDAVSGIRVVKSFSQEEREEERFEDKTSSIFKAQLMAAGTRALFNPSVLFVMAFGSLMVWLFGGRWVVLGVGAGALSIGTLVQFISYMNQLRQPVQQLIQLTEVFQQSATSAERVFNIMDMQSEVGDQPGAKAVSKLDGAIDFHDVGFRYHQDGERVLQDISFTLKPGQMLGLVGETGSGKSTLASLVCRFYDPTEGKVLVDGMDLRDLTVRSLRDRIGMVLQTTFLFAGTIRENLVYGSPEATEGEIVDAAKAANAHDFIMNLPDGYDSEIGERGAGLSGGEKQRISIARAVLKDPDILILDEATSAVDTATEQTIQKAMDRLVKGRTTIAIAHRLSTLRNADQLLVLEKGKILEQGTHQELLRTDGRYAELCRIQAEFAEHVAQ